MKGSTARKLRQIPEGSLLVGIDPHKKQHAVVVMTAQTQVVSRFKVSNSMEGFDELCQGVERLVRTGAARGAIYGLEAGGHYWRNVAYFLEGQGQPFRLINPYTLKRRREGDDLDRRKNDFRDALMAAELLRTGKFTETRLLYGVYAQLRASYQAYRRLRNQLSRTVNLLRALLDGLFPEFCQVFKSVTGKTALAILSIGSTPEAIAAMALEDLVQKVRTAYIGRRLLLKQLKALHALAQRSIGVRAGAEAVSTEVSCLAEQSRVLQCQMQRWEQSLSGLVRALPESQPLLSIPGVGPLTVAGLLGELGPLEGYRNAKQLVKMAGTNPTQSESAGKNSPHTPMSKKGRSGLRWCLWMASVRLMRHNPDFARWATERLQRPAQAHPLKPREVIGAVGNRFLRVAYALVKQNRSYQVQAIAL